MNLFRFVKVKDKLVALMIVCVLSNVLLGIFSIDYLRKMSWHASESYTQGLVPIGWLNELEEAQRQMDFQVMTGGNAKEVTTILHDMEVPLKKLENLSIDKKMGHQIKKYKALLAEQNTLIGQYKTLSDEKIESFYESTYLPASQKSHALLEETQSYLVQRAEKQHSTYQKDIQFGYWLLGIVSVTVVLLILVISFVATRAVNVPTRQLKSLLKRAEQGDFTGNASYSAQDELGDVMLSYNQMVTEVKSLLLTVTQSTLDVEGMSEKLQEASEKTTLTTGKIAKDIQGISNSATLSTQKLASNTSSLDEVLKEMHVVLEKAQIIEKFAVETVRKAEDGTQIVDGNLVQMKQIKYAVEKSNAAILLLVERATAIEQFIEVIESIAAQTNLLALNASIEAARAGENGKGFAVVANEVRKLAEQTVHSTASITTLVRNIQFDSNNAVQMMDHVMDATSKGVEVTGQSANSFNEILSKVHNMKPYIQEVSSTVKKVASYTEKVNEDALVLTAFSEDNATSTVHVAKLTEEQLNANQQVNNYIQEMKKVSKVLHVAVNRFLI